MMRLMQMVMAVALNRAPAPAQTMKFAGISWGDTPSAAEQKLRAGGFTVTGRTGEDIVFSGRVYGYDGTGWIYFANGRAVKALFIISPAAERVLDVYDRMQRELTRQYGPTPNHLELYREPFAKGDGRAAEAIRNGKATIASAWRDGPDTGPLKGDDPGVILKVNKDVTVWLSYESHAWHAEMERRQKSEQH